MDMTRAVQIAVARADLIACQILALPWGRMALSLMLAAVVIHVVKGVVKHG